MEVIFYNSFLILGIHFITRDGKIFGFLRDWFRLNVSKDDIKEFMYSEFMNLLNNMERVEDMVSVGDLDMERFDANISDVATQSKTTVLAKFENEIPKLPNTFLTWIANPLFECTICMSSFWGVIGFFVFSPNYYYNGQLPLDMLFIAVHCLMVAGFVGIVSCVYVAAIKIISN